MMVIDRSRPALWKTVGWATLAVIAAAIAILWSWNTLAVDLFALPQMQFRHALAVIVLAGLLGTVISFGARHRPGRHS
jgi:hypothetical protein